MDATNLRFFLLCKEYRAQINLELASKLIWKYIPVREEIQLKVEAFAHEYFYGKKPLGVHFRGTDKASEAPRVSWEYAKRAIANYLATHDEIGCLFVSSDEPPFIDYIKKEFGSMAVCDFDDVEKSRNGEAIHMSNAGGNNYYKGEEALINCLLLARCHALIKTASLFSAWASVFNPHLPVILLNKPYEGALWFPETEVSRKSMNEYLP